MNKNLEQTQSKNQQQALYTSAETNPTFCQFRFSDSLETAKTNGTTQYCVLAAAAAAAAVSSGWSRFQARSGMATATARWLTCGGCSRRRMDDQSATSTGSVGLVDFWQLQRSPAESACLPFVALPCYTYTEHESVPNQLNQLTGSGCQARTNKDRTTLQDILQ